MYDRYVGHNNRPMHRSFYNDQDVGYTPGMAKNTEPKNVAPKAYSPPTVKQIMRWQVSPAAKTVAYFIRLNRDKQTGWRHAPMKDLREEVAPATTYEQVESALKELATIGALDAHPKLGLQLSSKEKAKRKVLQIASARATCL